MFDLWAGLCSRPADAPDRTTDEAVVVVVDEATITVKEVGIIRVIWMNRRRPKPILSICKYFVTLFLG